MPESMFFVQSCSICANRGFNPGNILANIFRWVGTWCRAQKKDVKPYFCCRDFVLDAKKL